MVVTETSAERKITTHKPTANYPHISPSLAFSLVHTESESSVHRSDT